MPSNPRIVFVENELMHYGIMGQKWGKRRYQNEDGTLTPEGRERYAKAAGAKLTSLDRKSDRDRANLHDAKIRMEKATQKIERNSTKTRARLKAEKKLAKAASDADRYTKKISGNMDNVQKLIDELNSDWFTVDGRIVQRTAMSNRDALRSMATSLIGIYWETKVPGFAYDVADERRFQHSALAHHGIKGQKWGVRRFQNPDGTLTPAGRKRRAKYEAKINKRTKKLRAKMDEEGLNTDEKKPKTLSEMSIEELNEAVTRTRLEAQLYNEQFNRATNVAKLKEAQKSKGRKFVEDYAPKLVDQVLIPVAKDKLDKGTDALLRSVGLDLSSPVEKLQTAETMSKLRANIAENNKREREASDYDSEYAKRMRAKQRAYDEVALDAKKAKAQTQLDNGGYDPKGKDKKLSDYSDDAIEEEWKRRNS